MMPRVIRGWDNKGGENKWGDRGGGNRGLWNRDGEKGGEKKEVVEEQPKAQVYQFESLFVSHVLRSCV